MTFSGLKVYSTDRIDYVLVLNNCNSHMIMLIYQSDHLHDALVSIEKSKLQSDASNGECPENLLGLIFQIVPPSLKNLSQHPSIEV